MLTTSRPTAMSYPLLFIEPTRRSARSSGLFGASGVRRLLAKRWATPRMSGASIRILPFDVAGKLVMAALVAAIHVFATSSKPWMAGTRAPRRACTTRSGHDGERCRTAELYDAISDHAQHVVHDD